MKFILVLLLSVSFSLTAIAEESDWSWMKKAIENENFEFFENNKFDQFFRNETNQFKAYFSGKNRPKSYLADVASRAVFGIPEYPETRRGDVWFKGGCKAHFCPKKGFLWIDTKNKVSFFAFIHFSFNGDEYYALDDEPMLLLGSKQHKCDDLPKEALLQLQDMINNIEGRDPNAKESTDPWIIKVPKFVKVRCLEGQTIKPYEWPPQALEKSFYEEILSLLQSFWAWVQSLFKSP